MAAVLRGLIMTLEEVEQAGKKIAELAENLMQSHAKGRSAKRNQRIRQCRDPPSESDTPRMRDERLLFVMCAVVVDNIGVRAEEYSGGSSITLFYYCGKEGLGERI
jgi:hypothetical protein